MKQVLFVSLIFLGGCDANLGQKPGDDLDMHVDADTDIREDMDAPAELGEPCSGPSDCSEGMLCVGTSAGAFVCMALCQTSYDICPTGGVCLTLSGRPESVCYTGGDIAPGDACQTNIDCQSGLLCIGAQTQFFCTQACDLETQCPGGSFCSTLSSGASICVREIGQICESSGDCTAGLSCSSDEEGFVEVVNPGFCTVLGCEQGCPSLSMCMTLPDAPTSTCVAECQFDADCRFIRGWRCRDKAVCALFDDRAACESTLADRRACFPPEIP